MATAVWRGQLTFGLLTFPVKLYAAARRETISFRNMRKREEEEPEEVPPPVTNARKQPVLHSSSRVVEQATEHIGAEPVYTPEDRATAVAAAAAPTPAPAPIVKGYEFEPDRYVAIDPVEIRKLARSTSRDLEVTSFVTWSDVDPVYLDASYFIVPDPAGEKAYSLLYAAMKKTGFAAIGQIAMHGREQVLVIRLGPKGLVAHTMFYYPEVRRDQEFPAAATGQNPAELDLAAKLIAQLAGPFEPEQYVNAYKTRLEALIEEKVKRVPAAEPEQPAALNRKKPVDILEALKRSLQQVAERKPPRPTPSRTKRRSA